MSDRLLRPYTRLAHEWIEATAALPPTKAAHQIAEELLRITPTDPSEKSREALSWVIAAIDRGLTTRELLARVVAAYWIINDHHTGMSHSRTKQEEDVAVARWALRFAFRERRRRLPAKVSRYFGDLLRRGLARYALALLEYRRKTETEQGALIDRSAKFG